MNLQTSHNSIVRAPILPFQLAVPPLFNPRLALQPFSIPFSTRSFPLSVEDFFASFLIRRDWPMTGLHCVLHVFENVYKYKWCVKMLKEVYLVILMALYFNRILFWKYTKNEINVYIYVCFLGENYLQWIIFSLK